MSRLLAVTDSLVARLVPNVTAAAGPTYTERWCARHTCRANGKVYNELRERTCGDSWCGAWRKIGCC